VNSGTDYTELMYEGEDFLQIVDFRLQIGEFLCVSAYSASLC